MTLAHGAVQLGHDPIARTKMDDAGSRPQVEVIRPGPAREGLTPELHESQTDWKYPTAS